jgi:hypothetical protein
MLNRVVRERWVCFDSNPSEKKKSDSMLSENLYLVENGNLGKQAAKVRAT